MEGPATARRPDYTTSVRAVFEKRLPLYESIRKFVFPLISSESNWELVDRDFEAFISGITSKRVPLGAGSTFLSLTFPDVKEAVASGVLEKVTKGVDALELRVDLLKNYKDKNYVFEQYSTLRRHAFGVPVIFTIRSKGQVCPHSIFILIFMIFICNFVIIFIAMSNRVVLSQMIMKLQSSQLPSWVWS